MYNNHNDKPVSTRGYNRNQRSQSKCQHDPEARVPKHHDKRRSVYQPRNVPASLSSYSFICQNRPSEQCCGRFNKPNYVKIDVKFVAEHYPSMHHKEFSEIKMRYTRERNHGLHNGPIPAWMKILKLQDTPEIALLKSQRVPHPQVIRNYNAKAVVQDRPLVSEDYINEKCVYMLLTQYNRREDQEYSKAKKRAPKPKVTKQAMSIDGSFGVGKLTTKRFEIAAHFYEYVPTGMFSGMSNRIDLTPYLCELPRLSISYQRLEVNRIEASVVEVLATQIEFSILFTTWPAIKWHSWWHDSNPVSTRNTGMSVAVVKIRIIYVPSRELVVASSESHFDVLRYALLKFKYKSC